MKSFKKKILIDLDGVLNTYNGNYDENYIPEIREGAFEFIQELSLNYELILFTSRDKMLATSWIQKNGLTEFFKKVTNYKEPCFLIIDDRCLTFDGCYKKLKNKINLFQVWYK